MFFHKAVQRTTGGLGRSRFLKLIPLIFVSLTFFASVSLGNWFFLSAGNSWENLYGVCFPVSAETGWAVGDYGLILKTTNSGSSWSTQHTEDYQLLDVYFLDNQTGYAVGSHFTILKTTNGGANWVLQTDQQTYEYFESVHFPVDDQTGYAVGYIEGPFITSGVAYKTTNGGDDWFSIACPGTFPMDVYFPMGADTGYIAEVAYGGGHVYKTTNGGSGWGTTHILETDDGLRSLYYPFNPDLDGQQSTFTVVGDNGSIWKTTDYGQNWDDQSTGDATLMGVSFTEMDPGPGFNVGFTGSWENYGLTTTNGGTVWGTMTFEEGEGLTDLWMVDHNTGYAVGFSRESSTILTIMKTTDGGDCFFSAGVEEKEARSPRSINALVGIKPNPFVDRTVFSYRLAESSPVKLSVYNSAGQLVKTLASGEMVPSGVHQNIWDGKDMRGAVAGSGVYFVRFESGNTRLTKQIIKIK